MPGVTLFSAQVEQTKVEQTNYFKLAEFYQIVDATAATNHTNTINYRLTLTLELINMKQIMTFAIFM